MKGLRFFSRASDRSITLVSYHPHNSLTWHWALVLRRNALSSNERWRVHRASHRQGQWHDYYRLLFGWCLIVSRQDYHKTRHDKGTSL